MFKKIVIVCAFVVLGLPVSTTAQNANSSTVRPRTTSPADQNTNRSTTDAKTTAETPRSAVTTPAKKAAPASGQAKPKPVAPQDPASQSVTAAFNALINGIRKSDLDAITAAYWNSPRLVLFNNNGTVTKGWDQMRKNRESSIKDVKDVKLEVRDVSITMLGRDGAVVNALWTQSQDYKGQPETATGRMTLVFRRVGTAWKAIHLHTSPDRPDPSRVLPSEQTATPTPNP
ncbi:MAG TPA: AtzH-like domain-containing protein [Pyrinomonadaceae bacterium]|nr:AtzH-like domain-containing protein [Pyrinomonadaceae bacterium]